MAFLRSLLFALLFYPGTLVYVLTVIAVSPIGDRAGAGGRPRLVGSSTTGWCATCSASASNGMARFRTAPI